MPHKNSISVHGDSEFPNGGGLMGAAIRAYDWSSSPLGPVASWSPALRNSLNLILNSQESMFIMWGKGQTLLFNDAYRPTLGPRVDTALGQDIAVVWADTWAQVLPVVERAMAGEGTRFEQVPLTMARYGQEESTWWTFSFSPLYDDSVQIAGMLGITREVTEQVLISQRVKADYAALTQMFDQAPGFIVILQGPQHRIELTNCAYLKLIGSNDVAGKTIAEALPNAAAQGYIELLDRVYHSGQAYSAVGAKYTLETTPDHAPVVRYVDFIFQPVTDADGKVTGIFVEGSDVTERIVREEELVIARARADMTMDRISMALDAGMILGTFVWDIQDDLVTGDGRFARTFSVGEEAAAKGVPLSVLVDAIHPDDADRVRQAIEEAVKNGQEYNAEYRVRHRDKLLWVQASGRVEYDADGKPLKFPGVLSDINVRKEGEAAYNKMQEHLRLAQKAGGIGLFTLDIEVDKLTGSPEFFRIYGIEDQTVTDPKVFERLVFAEDVTVSNSEKRRTGNVELQSEYRIRRASDGKTRWISRRAEIIKNEKGQPAQMVGVAIDITDRKQAEIALHESQQHLSLMVESAKDFAIISNDLNGVIISWNSGAQRIFGYSAEEMLGHHADRIFVPEDREAGVPAMEMQLAISNGQSSDERWHLRANGERFYASGIMTAMRDESGNVHGFVKIARDMTAQKEAQEDLLEARNAAEAANIAKTEFLANMSHEIRTPMNAIIGLTGILGRTGPLNEKQRKFIDTLQMSADSLLSLINDLLDISKIEARTVDLEHIPFSIAQIIQEVVSMMAVRVREKNLSFTAESSCVDNRIFIGDPTRLRQIILNLCSNAIKFTDTGGVTISITCSSHDTDGMETICIAVSDTGIGIAPEKRETIFQKFMQADTSINRKYGGTGLGLAITKTLTEIMGGQIHLESDLSKGSTFTVRLPLSTATEQDIRELDGSLTGIADKMISVKARTRLLLVEDYEPNVLVASTLLEHFGYTIDVARNGFEAVEMAQSGQFALIIMDVQMHGMNGLDATALIRDFEKQRNLPRLPILGMTAHALAGDRERCLTVGMDDYIAKPFNPDELDNKIRNLLDS